MSSQYLFSNNVLYTIFLSPPFVSKRDAILFAKKLISRTINFIDDPMSVCGMNYYRIEHI